MGGIGGHFSTLVGAKFEERFGCGFGVSVGRMESDSPTPRASGPEPPTPQAQGHYIFSVYVLGTRAFLKRELQIRC